MVDHRMKAKPVEIVKDATIWSVIWRSVRRAGEIVRVKIAARLGLKSR